LKAQQARVGAGDALANDEFELWYQPWVSTSRVANHGFSRPRLFVAAIPTRNCWARWNSSRIAEESGLNVRLGRLVLRRPDAEDAAGWPVGHQAGIKLSAAQFPSRQALRDRSPTRSRIPVLEAKTARMEIPKRSSSTISREPAPARANCGAAASSIALDDFRDRILLHGPQPSASLPVRIASRNRPIFSRRRGPRTRQNVRLSSTAVISSRTPLGGEQSRA